MRHSQQAGFRILACMQAVVFAWGLVAPTYVAAAGKPRWALPSPASREEVGRGREEALRTLRAFTSAEGQAAKAKAAAAQAARIREATPDARLRREVSKGKALRWTPGQLRSAVAQAAPGLPFSGTRRRGTEEKPLL